MGKLPQNGGRHLIFYLKLFFIHLSNYYFCL